jgi:hypothetical protein
MLTAPVSLPVAAAPPSTLALEEAIGEIAAGAAVALAQALRDGLSPRTREHWSNSITRLFELRVYAGQIDFYATMRARGTLLLQERHGEDISARAVTGLIDGVLKCLQQVIRSELN